MKNEKSKFPPITQQSIIHIDGTPDDNYVLRILLAYRKNCNCKWEVTGFTDNEKLIYDAMNDHQDQRAKLLDDAIEILQNNHS